MKTNLKKLLSYYLYFASAVFLTTATSKLFSDFSSVSLKLMDPVLRIFTVGQLLVLVAAMEIGVAAYVLLCMRKKPTSALQAVMWLSSLFLLYRVGFVLAPGGAGACKCFGVGSFFGKMEPLADMASLLLLALLVVPGVFLLVLSRRLRPIALSLRDGSSPRIHAVLVATVALYTFHTLLAQELMFTPLYTAQGVITSVTMNRDSTPVATNRFSFEISKGRSDSWQIHLQSRIPQWDLTSQHLISWDGTNIYSVLYSDKAIAGNNQLISTLPLEAHAFPARICRGPFPIDHGPAVGLVWLVYLSPDFVGQHPKSRIPNLLEISARNDPLVWACDFQYQPHPSVSGLLFTSGVFRINKALLSKDLLDFPEVDEPATAKDLQDIQLRMESYSTVTNLESLTRASFSIEEVIEYEHLSIPKRFTSLLYSPHYLAGAPHYVMIRWIGEVTNCVFNTSPRSLLPPLVGTNFTVHDRRFMVRTRNGFLDGRWYKLGKGGWTISTNDLRISGTGRAPPLQPRTSTTGRRALYYIFVTLMVVTLSAPLLVAIWKRIPQRR